MGFYRDIYAFWICKPQYLYISKIVYKTNKVNKNYISNLGYVLTQKEIQILEFRKKGLKQSEIASKLKISQPAVSAFESNAVRKIRHAKKIMDFVKKLGIEYEEE